MDDATRQPVNRERSSQAVGSRAFPPTSDGPVPRRGHTHAVSRPTRRLRSDLLLACLLVIITLLLPATTWAQRVALVIGNAAYADRPLRNPVNDAQLMQTTLRDLGFQVQVATDVDRRGLLAALRDFEARARGAEVALFYFAGHGAQVGGANYLIPVNAPIRSETDVPDEALDASSVLRRIEEGRARVGLVILDACRDNPYPGSARSSTRGLARMSAPTGTIVAYATAPGSTADDGGSGPNGLYTGALVRHLSLPGLDIKEVFDRTAQDVERLSNGKQRPREEIGLRGRFVINEMRPALAAQTPAPAVGSGASSFSLADLEREAQVRRQWAEWQHRMQGDFDRAAAFQESPDLRVQAWQRFLGAWKDDNPTSGDDERLREQARQRLGDGQREVQAQQAARVREEQRSREQAAARVPGTVCERCPEMLVTEACKILPEDYPKAAKRAGTVGTTVLRILIEADGRVGRIEVERPSGPTREHRLLDAIAVKKLGECTYRPALDEQGRTVAGMRMYSVVFSLKDMEKN
jgi:TonB family protein